MSFWDQVAPPEDDIFALIECANPNLEKIIENEQLMATFRVKDERLLRFLLEPAVFDSIVTMIFNGKNAKVARTCVELFAGKGSPLVQFLVSDRSRAAKLVENVKLDD